MYSHSGTLPTPAVLEMIPTSHRHLPDNLIPIHSLLRPIERTLGFEGMRVSKMIVLVGVHSVPVRAYANYVRLVSTGVLQWWKYIYYLSLIFFLCVNSCRESFSSMLVFRLSLLKSILDEDRRRRLPFLLLIKQQSKS